VIRTNQKEEVLNALALEQELYRTLKRMERDMTAVRYRRGRRDGLLHAARIVGIPEIEIADAMNRGDNKAENLLGTNNKPICSVNACWMWATASWDFLDEDGEPDSVYSCDKHAEQFGPQYPNAVVIPLDIRVG